MPVRPPIRRVFAVQVVAAFLNHLLPAGSGGVVVNVRFLQRCGLSRGASLGVVGLKSLATGVTHLILLAGALAIAPSTLDQVRRHQESPSGRASIAGSLLHSRWSAALLIVLVTLIVLMVAVRGPRTWFARHLTRLAEMAQLRAVLRHPGRAAALWLGSLALPLCHAVVLWSILRSLQAPVAPGTVLMIYLGVSSLAAIVPSPGGIGGLDVALAAALIAIGLSSAVAVAAMLGYRMVTVWLPLAPAACMLALLLRRRII
jgi:uncharacterized membrane protein YbhN (UPF0104 family)